MTPLILHDIHAAMGAQFGDDHDAEIVMRYGDIAPEHKALTESAAMIDFTYRSRLCLVGADRLSFLNGQVTNNVKTLRPGQGCYAALVTAKGKIQSDLHIYCLEEELLLDFEPGLSELVRQRLEKYVIAEDVQIIDVAPVYGVIGIYGPRAAEVVGLILAIEAAPESPHAVSKCAGEIYVANVPRLKQPGFDLFVPNPMLEDHWHKAGQALATINGQVCGFEAFEIARVESGQPRFGVDMDESNLAPEAGIERDAISYAKGCYIGQEVIARIRTYGQVAKKLCRLRFTDATILPARGTKLFLGDKEVGYVTSAVTSPTEAFIGLGYVRKEAQSAGELKMENGRAEVLGTV